VIKLGVFMRSRMCRGDSDALELAEKFVEHERRRNARRAATR
jgi:hypothetical protein